jgi:bidirectional [NiFe] hydrogenase diaphorase subunit
VKGAASLLAALQREPLSAWGIELGSVRCLGTCSGAPLVVVDQQVWNQQSSASVLAGLRELRELRP